MKLAELVRTYVDFKRSLGMRYRSQGAYLHAFSRQTGNIELNEVTPQAVLAFINGDGPLTASWHQKHSVLNGLYRYAIDRNLVATSPIPTTIPKLPDPRPPHIYSTEEFRRLIAATDSLTALHHHPLQAETFRMLLLTLYGTALRISEALSLTLKDLDFNEGVLTVRKTKFYKTRWVPFGPRLAQELKEFLMLRSTLPMPERDDSAIFVGSRGYRWSYGYACTLFGRVRCEAGMAGTGVKRSAPCLHDIRHTAAVHRVLHWYRSGRDVQALLLPLATYLGHVEISSTQRYLTMTPELLQLAAQRFEEYAFQNQQGDL